MNEEMKIDALAGHEKEKERILPPLVVYLLRHGEATDNKTDANRELTDLGKKQVEEAIEKIINQLQEAGSNGNNANQQKNLLETTKFRIYDSGTPRTMEQAQIEKESLVQSGVPEKNIYILHPTYESDDAELKKQKAGPGITSRIGTVTESTPDFRKKLDDPEYQKSIGATDGVIAWMLTPDEEVPQGVNTYNKVKEYMDETKKILQRLAERIEKKGGDSVVVIANSHAPRVTVAISSAFNVDPRSMKMAGNAEGLCLKFNGNNKIDTELFEISK